MDWPIEPIDCGPLMELADYMKQLEKEILLGVGVPYSVFVGQEEAGTPVYTTRLSQNAN